MNASVKRAIGALGAHGVVGLVALLLGLGLMAWTDRWDAQAQSLRAQAQALRAQATPGTATRSATPSDGTSWLANLPGARSRDRRLADLLEMASALELHTASTEHRLSSSEGVERLRVTLPLKGSYAQVRRFVSAALAHDAALGLDGIKLRRASPLATEVEAELQWSLYARSTP